MGDGNILRGGKILVVVVVVSAGRACPLAACAMKFLTTTHVLGGNHARARASERERVSENRLLENTTHVVPNDASICASDAFIDPDGQEKVTPRGPHDGVLHLPDARGLYRSADSRLTVTARRVASRPAHDGGGALRTQITGYTCLRVRDFRYLRHARLLKHHRPPRVLKRRFVSTRAFTSHATLLKRGTLPTLK